MPKPTFFNLPEDKRRRFTDAALDEFALHDYRSASVSRIVSTLGIAKGSVYQYFEDKQELYLYLVTLAAQTKFECIDAAVRGEASVRGNVSAPSSEPGFFERYERTVYHGARFDFTHPRHGTLLYNATYEPSGEMLAVSARLREQSARYLRSLVEAGLATGDLRADLDVEFAVFALYQLTISLRDYLSERFRFSFKGAVQAGAGPPISDEALREVIAELARLLRQGLGPVATTTEKQRTQPRVC